MVWAIDKLWFGVIIIGQTERDEEMSEKCTTTACYWYDEQAEDNCGGELHGEPAIASCDRGPKGDPADIISALTRENAELRAALKEVVGVDDTATKNTGAMTGKTFWINDALNYGRNMRGAIENACANIQGAMRKLEQARRK